MDSTYAADTVKVCTSVSEQLRYVRRSVVSDLMEILTTEFTNIMKKAQESIVHFERIRLAANCRGCHRCSRVERKCRIQAAVLRDWVVCE